MKPEPLHSLPRSSPNQNANGEGLPYPTLPSRRYEAITTRKRIWVPTWLDKELTTLSNHKNVRKDDLLLTAAILGWEKLKDMTAEQIIGVLERETLK